jgi:hypothetical protein
MGFPPKFAEGLVSHKFSPKHLNFLWYHRSTNSTRNIRRNTKRNSHPKARHFKSVGMNSRRTPNSLNRQNKQNLQRSQRINLRLSRSKKLLKKFQNLRLKKRSLSR